MRDLMGEVVIVRDSTGSNTEGTFLGVEADEDGIAYVVLEPSRQLNYVDATKNPPTAEAWSIPGRNRIAKHMIVGIHRTHIAPAKADS